MVQCNGKEYKEHLNLALDGRPNIVIDDGGDLVHLLHTERTELLSDVMVDARRPRLGL